ncbi:MAG: hypothetical protein ACI97K_003425, partial [Glaciecola sp.]
PFLKILDHNVTPKFIFDYVELLIILANSKILLNNDFECKIKFEGAHDWFQY